MLDSCKIYLGFTIVTIDSKGDLLSKVKHSTKYSTKHSTKHLKEKLSTAAKNEEWPHP